MNSNKETAIRLVNLIQQADIELHSIVDYDVLKIHRPEVSDNIESKKKYFKDQQVNGEVEIARILEDGLYVALHFRVTVTGKSTINFHVYRFDEAGKLTEIWTNSQDELPARADGSTMLNGITEISDRDKTEETRALTNDIYNVQVNGPAERLPSFFEDGKMIQHNVSMEDDLSGMVDFLQNLAKEGRAEKINSYELCICEGNFSITATNANFGTENWAFFDMQRFENGKVAEHWDVIAPMPAPEEWKNNWGKFNFFKK